MPQVSPTRNHPRMSPTSPSPSSPTRTTRSVFMPSTRPKLKPVAEMTIQELKDRHAYNVRRLKEPTPSTSTYVQRISAEQAAIEDRLVELGVDNIQKLLNKTNLDPLDDQMHVDQPQAPPPPRPIGAKQRALAKFSARMHEGSDANVFTFQEAIQIEQEAHRLEQERKQQQEQKQEEKRKRMGLALPGEKALSRAEQEARIYAFMSYKPTESDLEDDDEEDDSDDDDPAAWFDDDQDDGRKGQDIIEPDYEDLSNIIRIDESRIPQNNFYEREGE